MGMKLNNKCCESIDESVLCWLATISAQGVPNVTPKQIFTHHNDTLLIAHIASPNTVANIQANPKVCVSMIEVFAMRGFKYIGTAQYFDPDRPEYQTLAPKLSMIAGSDFTILGVIQIQIDHIETIVAPSWRLFPERTLAERRQKTMTEDYGVQPIQAE